MPAVDFVQLALEESPLNETTYTPATVTPNRISTNLKYFPARSARVTQNPEHLRRDDELRGLLGEPPRLIETYNPAGVLAERCYCDDLTFLLELAGFKGVVTAGNGVITDPDANTIPVGAYKWVFDKRDAIDAQTGRLRINYATENVLYESYGTAVGGLSLNAQAELNADLQSIFMRRLAADTSTAPSLLATGIQPFRRGDLLISALAAGGRVSDWSLNIANSLERIRTLSLSTPSDWPDAHEFGDDQVMVTGTLPKRILDPDDVDALVSATTFAMTARFIGRSNIGATTKKYGLWITMPAVQYVGGQADDMGNKRRFGHSFDWFAAMDSVSGYDCRITLVNGVSAIATYV